MSRPSSSGDSYGGQPPHKRLRRSSSPERPHSSHHNTIVNGSATGLAPAKDQYTLPPLSLSILGVEPLDEFIREVADFVHHMIMHRPADLPGKVEVEAKIGLLKDKHSGRRITLPILTEAILAPDSFDCRFESNMSPRQHKHFNGLLNSLKINPPSPSTKPIDYAHLYLHDSFFASSESGPRVGDKIRVTRDEKTSAVVECVRKIRLGDLNIHSPKQPADWRISVNLEVPSQHPLGSPLYTRRKDRLSYSHEEFSIDLTQVTSSATPNSPPGLQHELEIEILRSDFLLSAATARGAPAPSDAAVSPAVLHAGDAFDELIRAFVNNARILVRNADGGEGAWG